MGKKKPKTGKPPTEQDILIAKFQACTGVQKHIIKCWHDSEEPKNENYDLIAAKRIIEKFKMQSYSKLLLYYMQFKRGHFDSDKKKIEYLPEPDYKEFERKTEMVNFLEHVLSKGKITSVQINKPIGPASIKDERLIDIVIESVKQEFVNRKYHITPLTIAEAEKIYNEQTDKKWFNGWIEQSDFIDEQGVPVEFGNLKNNKQYFDLDTGDIFDKKSFIDEMLIFYAASHIINREIDLHHIEIIKSLLEKEKQSIINSTVSPEKNKVITQIAFALADLMRINKFLSKPDINDINQITISADAGRLIHDLLFCFGMIENKAKPKGKDERHKFAKDLIRNKLNKKTPDSLLYFRLIRLKALKN